MLGVATPASADSEPLLWLALVSFAICLGWGIVSPVLPPYASNFGVGSLTVGVLVASFSVSTSPLTSTAGG